jgi:hypothetical protein
MLFLGIPASAVGMDGGYYFDRNGKIVGTYEQSGCDHDTYFIYNFDGLEVKVRPWCDCLDDPCTC